ncbi:MAG: peptidase M14, partial [Betaproteobacteria bacterium]|nr:peptidase M14 [Betaproteobacteria bacterium]
LPYDLIVIGMRRDPVVHTGERFAFVGQEWDEVAAGA